MFFGNLFYYEKNLKQLKNQNNKTNQKSVQRKNRKTKKKQQKKTDEIVFFEIRKNQLFSICFKNRKKTGGIFPEHFFQISIRKKSENPKMCSKTFFQNIFQSEKIRCLFRIAFVYVFFFTKKEIRNCASTKKSFFFFGIAFVLKCVGLLVYDSLRT